MLSHGTGRERWLISYADFITLLFATFVLMFVASKNKEHSGPHPAAETSKKPEASRLLSELSNTLSLERASRAVNISSEPRGIIIALDDQTCFEAGDADVQPAAVPVFQKIAAVLAKYPNRILLQGHTDSTPIHNSRFRSNWELSAARSIAVMQLMESQKTVAADRFLIAGAAEVTPVSTNDTEEGRSHNRRVDVVVLDDNAGASAASILSASAQKP